MSCNGETKCSAVLYEASRFQKSEERRFRGIWTCYIARDLGKDLCKSEADKNVWYLRETGTRLHAVNAKLLKFVKRTI